MNEPITPTIDTDTPDPATEHSQSGDARQPSDTLDKGQPDNQTIPRKSSLLPD